MDGLGGEGGALVRPVHNYAAWLPMLRHGSNRIWLSEIDQWLLGSLSTRWSTAGQLVKSTWRESERWLYRVGDLPIWYRLDQWATLPSRPVERIITKDIASPAYRLGRSGKKLLKEGIGKLSEAPVCPIGGFTAYGRPWFHATSSNCSMIVGLPSDGN